MKDIILNLEFLGKEIVPISEKYQTIGQLAGENKQQVLVILLSAQYEIIEFKALLEKILASVGLHPQQDVLTFALTSHIPFNLLRLAAEKNCTKVIVFGVPLQQMGIHRILPKFEVVPIANLELVISDSFPDLEADLSKKNKLALWNALKILMEVENG